MSPWDQLCATLDRAHGVDRIGPQTLRVVHEVTPGRLQEVYLAHVRDNDDQSWAQADAPIAQLSQIDLHRALRAVEKAVCGGLCHLSIGGIAHVSVRQAILLPATGEVPLSSVAPVLRLLTATAVGLADELR